MPPRRAPSSRVTKSKAKGTNTKKPNYSSLRKSAKRTAAPTSTDKSSTSAMAGTTVSSISSSAEDTAMQPVYFWKPTQGNGYLGQWYPSVFTYQDDTYATAEMWMMVQKARLFEDEVVAQKMLATTDPKRHKALGREVKNFDQKKWDENKRRIVEEGNYHKFTISEDAQKLREMLLETGERELVEASSLDRIWGVGFAEKNGGANRQRWGQNLLGKALMDVRKRLMGEMA